MFPDMFRGTRVLEIGSLDVNGSVRQFFNDCQYTGVDVAPGPGVDVVGDGSDAVLTLNDWDVVCSCEMFEHNPRWSETWRNMVGWCRSGGLVFMSCATEGRPEHGTSRTTPADSPLTVARGWEHYRNLTEADFRGAVDVDKTFSRYRFYVHLGHKDLYFYGIKR
jgi:hypothetical protein